MNSSHTNGRSKKTLTRYQLSATVWAEGKYYVSKCPELGVTSFGLTPEKALQKTEDLRVWLAQTAALYSSN